MSLLLRPRLPLPGAALVTPLAAVAVCRAIEGCTGLAPGIKWVNDIVLEKGASCEGLSASRTSRCTSTDGLDAPREKHNVSSDSLDAPLKACRAYAGALEGSGDEERSVPGFLAGSDSSLPAYSGKVCGILTESAASPDGSLSHLILGIGINLCPPEEGFPGELAGIAASLFDRYPGRVAVDNLINAFLDNFRVLYEKLEKDPENRVFLAEYKKRSIVLGRNITIHKPGHPVLPAKAIDIDNDYRLIVRYDDGRVEALNSGEISIRPV